MQTWNNILNYIKRQLGAKLNILEMSDDEIIEGLKEDTIVKFSQYSPRKKAYKLTHSDLSDSSNTGGLYTFTINTPDYIVDILEVYTSSSSKSIDDTFEGTKYEGSPVTANLYDKGSTGVAGGGIIDTVIDNKFYDMVSYLSAKNTWEFIPPRQIMFDSYISGAIIIYNTHHNDLNTILPDYYALVFKKMCLCDVIDWIVALRSKYESVSSPLGELQMNIQQLETKKDRLESEYMEFLNAAPPDVLLHIF